MDISVVITSYNEGEYLNLLLNDLSKQNVDNLNIEIILLEAGFYNKKMALECLDVLSSKLLYIYSPDLSRTKSLNKIFNIAKGELIVRLDARSHIQSDYLKRICQLSKESNAENVGGVMLAIGKTPTQKLIAKIMMHPLAFGGGVSRKLFYKGFADSVYLGAYQRKKYSFLNEWFDSLHPRISEDSDLNYRLRKAGGKVFMDPSIVVEYYSRETLKKFFRLCFNYGVGRGIFIIKHRSFSAVRQLAPPIGLIVIFMLLVFGFNQPILLYLVSSLFLVYALMLTIAISKIKVSFIEKLKIILGFLGCHFFWALGVLISPYYYINDIKKSID